MASVASGMAFGVAAALAGVIVMASVDGFFLGGAVSAPPVSPASQAVNPSSSCADLGQAAKAAQANVAMAVAEAKAQAQSAAREPDNEAAHVRARDARESLSLSQRSLTAVERRLERAGCEGRRPNALRGVQTDR